MNNLNLIHSLIEKRRNLALSKRESLLAQMDQNREAGVSCQNCEGHCCTFKSNSMKVRPSEALDLIDDLLFSKGQDRESLRLKMKETIHEFRLDKDLSFGKSYSLRRYYTCPFFLGHEHGCSVSRKKKPYGCLAFEPQVADPQWDKRECRTRGEFLENQIIDSPDDEIRELLGLSWEKTSIPEAVLDILDFIDAS